MSVPLGEDLEGSDRSGDPRPRPARGRVPWLSVLTVTIVWFVMQGVTPSLSGFDGGALQDTSILLLQGCIAAAIALVLVLRYPADARELFAPSKALWFYLLVPLAVVIYVIRAGSGSGVIEALGWVAVAAAWRWFLFGMLQRRLREWLSPMAVWWSSAILLASWLTFSIAMTTADAFRFPLALILGLLLLTLFALIPSVIVLTQKNVHALIVLNLIGSTLIV